MARSKTINTLTRSLLQSGQYENWNNLPGKRIRLEYYTGVETGNPSGTTSNIKFIFFETLNKQGSWSKGLQKELTYDTADNLLTTAGVRN